MQDEYKKYLAEIIIDGYTDTDGDYTYNLELSQRRSLAVAEYLTEIREDFLNENQISDLQTYLTVNGHSSANPILDAQGNVNKDASRRVEVKFRLKDEEMIDELNQIMSSDSFCNQIPVVLFSPESPACPLTKMDRPIRFLHSIRTG